jgi:hypothetical protein
MDIKDLNLDQLADRVADKVSDRVSHRVIAAMQADPATRNLQLEQSAQRTNQSGQSQQRA